MVVYTLNIMQTNILLNGYFGMVADSKQSSIYFADQFLMRAPGMSIFLLVCMNKLFHAILTKNTGE